MSFNKAVGFYSELIFTASSALGIKTTSKVIFEVCGREKFVAVNSSFYMEGLVESD